LRHLLGDPGLLQRVAAVGREPLDGGDRQSLDHRHRRDAGTNGIAVDVHGAGAAGRDPAAELGTGQLEMLAQHPQQRRVAVDPDLLALTIEGEGGHGGSSVKEANSE
jgi:hypothetical protein